MLKRYIINNEPLDVNISIKRNNKNIYLRVRNHKIYMSMPYVVDDKIIISMLQKNYFKLKEAIKPDKQIHYLGRLYDYQIIKSTYDKVLFLDKIIIYTVNDDLAYVGMLLRNAYINEAYKYIKPIINKALVDFKDDIKMPLKFNYKYMTSAFGNCYPKKGRITFSGICAKLEPKLIELVVYHEFTHLRYLGHDKNFYNYLESKLTDAILLSKILRKEKVTDFFDWFIIYYWFFS